MLPVLNDFTKKGFKTCFTPNLKQMVTNDIGLNTYRNLWDNYLFKTLHPFKHGEYLFNYIRNITFFVGT